MERWPHLAPLAKLRGDVPAALDAVIVRALAYDRDARFESCAKLEAALEQIAQETPPLAAEKTVARWIEAMLALDRVAPRAPAHSPAANGGGGGG